MCKRFLPSTVLRNSGPIPGVYRQGDLIMYKVEQQSEGIEDQRWHGPARILGLDPSHLARPPPKDLVGTCIIHDCMSALLPEELVFAYASADR